MNIPAVRSNRKKFLIMVALVFACAVGYMLIGVNLDNAKLFQYAMKIRREKAVVSV